MIADKQIVESVRRIVEYMHDDEERHFDESEGDDRKRHIFRDVQALKTWLENRQVNRCVNCGGKTKYPKYCTRFRCRQKAGTAGMYYRPRRKAA
jgi:hypothetical protein